MHELQKVYKNENSQLSKLLTLIKTGVYNNWGNKVQQKTHGLTQKEKCLKFRSADC